MDREERQGGLPESAKEFDGVGVGDSVDVDISVATPTPAASSLSAKLTPFDLDFEGGCCDCSRGVYRRK